MKLLKIKSWFYHWPIIVALFFSLSLISLATIKAERSEAIAFLPVGGRILAVTACCNGLMLTIGTPTPGLYMYNWGTPLYPFYNISIPGPHVLGRAFAGGVCQNAAPPIPCALSIKTTGTFVFLGTSGL